MRSDLEMLTGVIGTKIDTLLVSETKLDDNFLLSQFIAESFTPPYRPNRSEYGGDLMLFIKKEISSKLLPNVNTFGNIDNIFVEINLR